MRQTGFQILLITIGCLLGVQAGAEQISPYRLRCQAVALTMQIRFKHDLPLLDWHAQVDERGLTRAHLVVAFQGLEKAKAQMNYTHLLNNPTDPISMGVLSKSGISLDAQQFARLAFRIFGSWDKALAAAGIDPATVRLRRARVPFRHLDLVRIVQRIFELGYPMGASPMIHQNAAFETAMLKEFGHPIAGQSLFDAAEKYHGSWEELMKKAHIPESAYLSERVDWRPSMIGAAIRKLYELGLPMDQKAVQQNKDPRAWAFLKELTGKPVSPRLLTVAALRMFGTWNTAQIAAGVPVENILKPLRVNLGSKRMAQMEAHIPLAAIQGVQAEQILRALRDLSEARVDLEPRAFLFDSSPVVQAILDSHFDFKMSRALLVSLATEHFLTWSEAVSESRARFPTDDSALAP